MFDFLRRSGPQSPSTAVRRALEQDGLVAASGATSFLSVVESRGTYAGRNVRYFRVFDPVRAGGRGLKMNGYADLDRHSELVIQAGRIEKDGVVVINRQAPWVTSPTPVRISGDRTGHGDDERFVFPETFTAEARKVGRP